ALASERRSITPRINAGTERRPLASTALSALPLKRCSSSTSAPVRPERSRSRKRTWLPRDHWSQGIRPEFQMSVDNSITAQLEGVFMPHMGISCRIVGILRNFMVCSIACLCLVLVEKPVDKSGGKASGGRDKGVPAATGTESGSWRESPCWLRVVTRSSCARDRGSHGGATRVVDKSW